MGFNIKVGNSNGLKVAFSSAQKPLSIKSSAAATSLDTLPDVDISRAKELQADPTIDATGTSLIYNSETGVFEAKKVWEYNEEENQLVLNGGEF